MITKLTTKRKQPLEDYVLYLTHSEERKVPEFKQTPEQMFAIIKMLEAIYNRSKDKGDDPFDASEYEEHWGKWAKFRKNWFNQEINPLCTGTFEEVRAINQAFFMNREKLKRE